MHGVLFLRLHVPGPRSPWQSGGKTEAGWGGGGRREHLTCPNAVSLRLATGQYPMQSQLPLNTRLLGLWYLHRGPCALRLLPQATGMPPYMQGAGLPHSPSWAAHQPPAPFHHPPPHLWAGPQEQRKWRDGCLRKL